MGLVDDALAVLSAGQKYVGRPITGAQILLADTLLRPNPLDDLYGDRPGNSQAFREAARRGFAESDGNLYERLVAANEAAAGVNPYVTGLSNLALDPLNLIGGPVGKVAGGLAQAAPEASLLARALGGVARADNAIASVQNSRVLRPALTAALSGGLSSAAVGRAGGDEQDQLLALLAGGALGAGLGVRSARAETLANRARAGQLADAGRAAIPPVPPSFQMPLPGGDGAPIQRPLIEAALGPEAVDALRAAQTPVPPPARAEIADALTDAPPVDASAAGPAQRVSPDVPEATPPATGGVRGIIDAVTNPSAGITPGARPSPEPFDPGRLRPLEIKRVDDWNGAVDPGADSYLTGFPPGRPDLGGVRHPAEGDLGDVVEDTPATRGLRERLGGIMGALTKPSLNIAAGVSDEVAVAAARAATPQPNILPPSISPGRAALVERYTAQGLPDIGLTPGPGIYEQQLRGALAGSTLGAAAGATQGDTLEERLDNAGRGAFYGATGGAVVGTARVNKGLGRPGGAGMAGITPQVGQFVQTIAARFGGNADELANVWQASVDAMRLDRAQVAGTRKWTDPQTGRTETVKNVTLLKPVQYLGQAYAQWRQQVLGTPRNALQGKAYTRFVNRELGGDPALLDEVKADRDAKLRAGADGDWDRLATSTQTLIQRSTGRDIVPDLGIGRAAVDNRPVALGPYARAANGAVMGVFSAGGLVNPVAGALSGAARGYLQPAITAAARTAEDATAFAGREALFQVRYGKGIAAAQADFLATLAAGGVDVTALRARGLFSPADVRTLLGGAPDAVRLADRWNTLQAAVWTEAEAATRWTFGDFGKENAAQRVVSAIFPFTQFYIKAAQPALTIAAKRPAITAGVIAAQRRRGAQEREEGGYSSDALKAPVPGTGLEANPLQLLSPLPIDLASGAEQRPGAPERNAYEKARDALAAIGFRPNPLLANALYATGADYRPPAPLSRAAGLESALPGPYVASPVKPIFDAARAGSAALAALAQGKSQGEVMGAARAELGRGTPVDRRLNEIVIERTGKPLADPQNAWLVQGLVDPEAPATFREAALALRAEAEASVRSRGGVTGALSLLSPFGFSRPNPVLRAANVAKRDLIPYEEIQRAAADDARLGRKKGQGEADRLRAENEARKRANPPAATYDNASGRGRKLLLVAEWERNSAWLLGLDKRIYDRELSKFKRSIGLD